MIIDFHSHIMPAFDDGAKDAKMSIAMLQKSMDQGVETVVSTSHCYPMSGRDITEFTDKRQTAYNVLMEAVKADNAEIPKLVPAAEVHLSCDIASLKGIEQLCIGDTRRRRCDRTGGKGHNRLYQGVQSNQICYQTCRKSRKLSVECV